MTHASAAPRTRRATTRLAAEGISQRRGFVSANLRRNYLAHYVHGMLGMTGFRLLNAPTIVPTYLHLLTGSAALVGLGQALQQFGTAVAPVLGAARIEGRARALPTAMRIGAGMRVPILGLALAAWFLEGTALVVATMGCLLVLGLFTGAQRVVFQALLAKVIPIDRRGRLQAWRNLTGGAIAAALAWAAGHYFIERGFLGNGYAATFFLAFLLTAAGLAFLGWTLREPDAPTVRPPSLLADRLRDFPALLADPGYRRFVFAQSLAAAARLSAPFYVLHAGTTLPLDGATIGLLSLAFLGADTLSNLLWGYLGDRRGFRLVFLLALVVWLFAIGAMLWADDRPGFALAFAGLGAANSGAMMAATTLVLEFGRREDVAMRLALSATAEGAIAAVAPLLGGLLALWTGYPPLLVLSSFCVVGALILLLRLRDPRGV